MPVTIRGISGTSCVFKTLAHHTRRQTRTSSFQRRSEEARMNLPSATPPVRAVLKFHADCASELVFTCRDGRDKEEGKKQNPLCGCHMSLCQPSQLFLWTLHSNMSQEWCTCHPRATRVCDISAGRVMLPLLLLPLPQLGAH